MRKLSEEERSKVNEIIGNYKSKPKKVDAVELIATERNEKQIGKHGFTAEHHANHPEWYEEGQLIEAANTLSMKEIKSCLVPLNWDIVWFEELCTRPYQERLIISAALIASEWDRLEYLKNNNVEGRV